MTIAASDAGIGARARLESMVEALRSCPDVVLLHAELGAGASADEMGVLKDWLGELPAAVRAFYSEVNGVQVRWMAKKSPRYVASPEKFTPGHVDWDYALFDTSQNMKEDGVLILPPLLTIPSIDWVDRLDGAMGLRVGDGELSNAELADAVRVFDWSSFYYWPGLVKPAGTVVIAGDHGIDWGNTAIAFEKYLDAAITSFAITGMRMKSGRFSGKKTPETASEAAALVASL